MEHGKTYTVYLPKQEEPKREKPKKIKKKGSFGKFVINALVYILIVGGITVGVPRFLSWSLDTPYPMATITSGSMWPVLKEGDLVFIKGIHDKSDIHLDDVIVFRNKENNTFTIHRVVALGEKNLTTQGDANFSKDAPVPYEDVVGSAVTMFGQYVRIPRVGFITVYASKKINNQNAIQ